MTFKSHGNKYARNTSHSYFGIKFQPKVSYLIWSKNNCWISPKSNRTQNFLIFIDYQIHCRIILGYIKMIGFFRITSLSFYQRYIDHTIQLTYDTHDMKKIPNDTLFIRYNLHTIRSSWKRYQMNSRKFDTYEKIPKQRDLFNQHFTSFVTNFTLLQILLCYKYYFSLFYWKIN